MTSEPVGMTAVSENLIAGTGLDLDSAVAVVGSLTTSVQDDSSNSPTSATYATRQNVDRARSDDLGTSRVLTKKRLPTHEYSPTRARFLLHEMYEGVVEEVYNTYFVAQIASKTLPDTYEIAEIYIREISIADHELLRPGAVFYWAIGYEDRPSGQRIRSSIIRFRRLPAIQARVDDPWIEAVQDQWLTSS